MWRIIRKITIYLCAFIILLLGIGFIYEWIASSHNLKSYRPIDKLYDIEGHRMHSYTEGQGDVTVIFASGWGTANPYVDFYPLYEKLAPHVKIVVYDRFGYGYSDTTGKKRDIDTITDEIHELLRVSGQKPPYIMVGHSLGSLETIRYAQRFPEEVKGIILIEGGSPEYYASSKPFVIIPIIQRILIKSGVARALYHMDGFAESLNDERNELKLLPDALKQLDRTSTLLKAGNKNMIDEIRQSQKNAELIMKGRKPLDIPIRVLTADSFGRLTEDNNWMESEAALPSWSTSGKQIIVQDTSHYLHHYKPEVVIKEILEMADIP